MTALTWDDRLLVGVEPMDQTHREFVDLVAALGVAPDAEVLPCLDRLIEHTVLHFGQEDIWMADAGWGPPCHTGEHMQVLEILHTVRKRVADDGEMRLIGVLVTELGPWFEHHATNMDAALVAHMANVGYQPVAIADVQALAAARDRLAAEAAAVEEPAHACGSGAAAHAYASDPAAHTCASEGHAHACASDGPAHACATAQAGATSEQPA